VKRAETADFHVPARLCPSCFEQLDGASKIDSEGAPVPGDVSFCIYCAAMLRFGDDMALVAEDRPESLNDPKLLEMQQQVKTFLEEVKRNGLPLRCYACERTLPEELKKLSPPLEPGMCIVCAFCAAVNLYNTRRQLVELTDEELLNSEEMRAAVALVQESIDKRKAHAH